jgi:hypothetical protein
VSAVNGQPPSYSALRTAMLRGGPDPTEIIFAATVRPTSTDSENELAAGNKATAKTKGPYRRYAVQFGIDAHDVECAATPDGIHQCAFDAVIFVYDADGTLLNSQSIGLNAKIPADKYASILQTGIRFSQQISVPLKGETFLRIGVHDATTNRVGAVELPVAAVSKLEPLPAPSAKQE